MKFLIDYPTLTKLKLDYPGISKVDAGFLTMGNARFALEAAVSEDILASLLKSYSAQEVLFGLRTLLGSETGKNQYSMLLSNGVIVKYGGYLSQSELEPSRMVQERIVRCVELARKVLRSAMDIGNNESAALESVLGFHFKCVPDDAAVIKIAEFYKNISRGVSGHIRIANTVASTAAGYVTWKDLEAETDDGHISSPFHSYGERDGESKRAGSIHIDFAIVGNKSSTNLSRLWTDLAIAGLIIHEASHKFCFTTDHAYCHDGDKYTSLSKELLLDNADSYGYAAISLHIGRLIRDTDDDAVTMKKD